MTKGYYSEDFTVVPSQCDVDAKMSVPAILDRFMDAASVHAEMIGVGIEAMRERGLFWLTAKTRVRILYRPSVMEPVTVRTWPQPALSAFCTRDYRITGKEGTVAEGRSVWAVLDTETGKVHPMKGIYPPDFPYETEENDLATFARIDKDFSHSDVLGTYRVRSVDIDFGEHMNNVAYVRALFGCFPCAYLQENPVTELELNFLSPCHEGDLITFRSKKTAQGTEICAERDDGTLTLLAVLKP